MGPAYAMIFAGVIGLAAGGYSLMGGTTTGLVFFAFGWTLIILGIRKAVMFKKGVRDAG